MLFLRKEVPPVIATKHPMEFSPDPRESLTHCIMNSKRSARMAYK